MAIDTTNSLDLSKWVRNIYGYVILIAVCREAGNYFKMSNSRNVPSPEGRVYECHNSPNNCITDLFSSFV